ncbi:AI-2 transport protein TqsA [Neorhodopirellula pilleata]|uniref:AI-2 transport protein TqsA n=2 Tax=Neorhodopirellula pilleata TaxID=2714738 RepID=A0A5C6A579_9BACT|nr:AI-2 transport protein TqsA [Neorhodopirellula pilleata]
MDESQSNSREHYSKSRLDDLQSPAMPPPPTRKLVSGRFQRKTPDVAVVEEPTSISIAIHTIAVLMVCGTLYVASSLLIPVVIAALAYLTLRPLVARMCQHGIPQSLASGILILAGFAIVAVVATLLYTPTQRWLIKAPQSVARMRAKLSDVAEPLTVLDRANERLEGAAAEDEIPIEVSIEKPSMVDQTVLINKTGQLLAFIAAVAVLTFFMLSTGDDFLNRVLGVLSSEQKRAEVLGATGKVQDSVGKYLSQITLINIGLGIVVTSVMWAVGMPTPVLWGVIATLFNFIPYVGPLAGTAIVFLAAASVFEGLGRSVLTALAFWLTTAVEGQFVTPSILGKTLKVGPVVVLVAVAFWGFLWGLPGVFLAVPLLIVQREVFACFDATYPIAVVLGEDPCRPGDDCEPIQEDELIGETIGA